MRRAQTRRRAPDRVEVRPMLRPAPEGSWSRDPGVVGRCQQSTDGELQTARDEVRGAKPPREEAGRHPYERDERDESEEADALIADRPGRWQQILDDVRAVERRNRDQVEHQQRE